MSRLADLIAQLCPDGVEYKPIGSFAQCVAGATPNSKDPSLWDGNIPWMSSGEVNKRIIRSTDRCITQRGFDSCSTKMIPAGAVVVALAGQGKTRGTVARTRIELCTNQSLCAIISDANVDSDFLFHYLVSQYNNLRAVSSGDGTRGGLNLKMIREYRVPVPPVEIQREIVRILDQFTTLEAELEAELEARRAQYEHYRNHLLSYESLAAHGQVEMVKLGELAHIATGGRNTSDAVEDGAYPFYVRSQVPLSLNEYDFDESAVLTAGDGVGVGRVFHHVEGKYALHQRAYRIVPNLEVLSSRYLYHVMVSQFGRYLESTVFHSSVTSVRKPMLERFPVAVPPMEEQDRVADVLDRFDALVNDITSGLPAEIAARRAQYEHYRDRLLSFPEKAGSGGSVAS